MNNRTEQAKTEKSTARRRADAVKAFRCKNLIAVIENPTDIRNIGTVIRNVNALGVEKAYMVDRRRALTDDWQDMRTGGALSKSSVSAIKWSFVRRFDTTEACLAHLARKNFKSIVTSPHVKGKRHAVFDELDYTIYTKLAIWFGNESRGISDTAVQSAGNPHAARLERARLSLRAPTKGPPSRMREDPGARCPIPR